VVNKSAAPPGLKLVPALRSALSLAALAAVLVLAIRLAFPSSSPPGLAAALASPGPQPPAVNQDAATTCFEGSPAVSAVRSAGAVLLVRFVGQTGFMKLEFFSNEDAAIRASYERGSPNSFHNNIYNNTLWSHVPSRLTKGDISALSTCLPAPKLSK
jgi:hypothetical protein